VDLWLRAIVTDPERLREDDDALAARVAGEVGSIMEASAPPLETRIHRWDQALPVYEPGHFDRVAAAERALPDGIAIAGASYRGVGVPDCIASGRDAARRLVNRL
jgi:oxygen-dependent protoporphyrinogen oxidase